MGGVDSFGVMEAGVFREIDIVGIAKQGNIFGSGLVIEKLAGIQINTSKRRRRRILNE